LQADAFDLIVLPIIENALAVVCQCQSNVKYDHDYIGISLSLHAWYALTH